MKDKRYYFTSESVGEGHPDKLCDQVSDAVLDACLRDDRKAHVACECYATTGMVLIGGEITTDTYVDIQQLARDVVKDIGYTNPDYGIDYESMAVLNVIHAQSPDIDQGVEGHRHVEDLKQWEGKQGAGDQGMMFGFACSETPELMPAPIMYAHRILENATRLRKEKKIPWLRPDAKSQVTLEYEGHKPVRADTIVVSHQHDPEVPYKTIKEAVIEEIIRPILGPTGLLTPETKFFVNPTGRFVIGGPTGDTGLTGRKIIVDTYGGMGRHGGGAFSGKDPSKVDRSAAYMARYVAKNVVAAGLAERCEVQLAYAIGVPEPVSVMVDTFDTSDVPEHLIADAIRKVFQLDPHGIIKTLDLLKPVYRKTAAYGHFGRDGFTWERTDKAAALKKAIR